MRKLQILSLTFLMIFNSTQAQLLKKIMPETAFSAALSAVIENYPNNYNRIQGASLPSDDDRDIFVSGIGLPGASLCVIYRFHSKEDTTASWQARLYNGEDYAEAVRIYKSSFKQLKQTRFNAGSTKLSFDGQMEPPAEELRFSSSILRPSERTNLYKNFTAEIEIVGSATNWSVNLNLFSRKEDTERY